MHASTALLSKPAITPGQLCQAASLPVMHSTGRTYHAKAEDVRLGSAVLQHDLLWRDPVKGADATFHICAGPCAVLCNANICNLGLQG